MRLYLLASASRLWASLATSADHMMTNYRVTISVKVYAKQYLRLLY